jgi:hypothetical protein
LALQEKKLAPATFAKAGWTFETLVFPYIGLRPIAKLGAMDVLKVLKRIRAGAFTKPRTNPPALRSGVSLCRANGACRA